MKPQAAHAQSRDPLVAQEFRKHVAAARDGDRCAAQWLLKCHTALGVDGAVILRDALIRDMSARQLATVRGKSGAAWERFYARRVQECLRTLGEVYGFDLKGGTR